MPACNRLLLITLVVLPAAVSAVERSAVAEHYAELVAANYQDAVIAARQLEAAVARFVAEPSEETLIAAKAAWLQARDPYSETEAYRFYGGPIDDEDGPEALLNAWPLDEGYIEQVPGSPTPGIIEQVEAFPELSAELLRELNEREGDANISTGYHAIEFLLWGQDRNDEDPLAPGQRPVSDYTTAAHAARRGRYLEIVTAMVVEDLLTVAAEWRADEDNYRAAFTADADAALGHMIVGIGSLAGGELAGERMAVALTNRDQEDEQSCFSDNTHADLRGNAAAVANVWQGRYRRIDGSVVRGPGLRDALRAVDAELTAEVDAALGTALAAVAAVEAPFDRELVEPAGRARIEAAIAALWDFTALMPRVAEALGVEAPLEGL